MLFKLSLTERSFRYDSVYSTQKDRHTSHTLLGATKSRRDGERGERRGGTRSFLLEEEEEGITVKQKFLIKRYGIDDDA